MADLDGVKTTDDGPNVGLIQHVKLDNGGGTPTTVTVNVSTDIEGGGYISVGTTAVEATFTGATSSIIISAKSSNTGTLFIGKSDVTNTGANAIAFLEAGESLTIDYNDASNGIYVVSDTAAQSFMKGASL